MFAFVSSSQMFPLNQATAAKLRPSRLTSPKLPSLMCHTRTPSQSPSVGGWANVHGQGMAHLQTSNQSPTRCQLGTSAILSPPSPTYQRAPPILAPANRLVKGAQLDRPRRLIPQSDRA